MSIFSRACCDSCGSVSQHKMRGKNAPVCKCGVVKRWYDPWYVKIRDENGIAQTTTHTTKASAEKYQAEQQSLKSNGESIAKRDTSFMNAYKLFMGWCDQRVEIGKLKVGSCRVYKSRMNKHILPHFKYWDIRNINHLAAAEYTAKRMKEKVGGKQIKSYSQGEINRELAALKKLLSVAKSHKLVRENPLANYEFSDEGQGRDRVLNLEEIERLLSACKREGAPDYLHTMVLLALNTGLRREGIMGLQWEHISNNVITRVVKNDKTVRIPLTEDAAKELQRWEQVRYKGVTPLRKTGLVFPSPLTGQAFRVSSDIGFNTAVKIAGLQDFHFHDLRHNAATYMIAHCKDIHMVASILGHSSTYMTERYAHVIEERTKTMIAGFAISKVI